MIDEQLGLIPYQNNNTNPKELFDVTDIEAKTELTSEQVMIISRLKILGNHLKEKYNIDIIDTITNNFLQLQISKDRKSRGEFVSAFQSKNDERAGNFLDKFNLSLGGK